MVKGLEIPASRTIIDPTVDRRIRVDGEEICLPDAKVGRLAEFISRIVVAKEPLYRNCMTFAAFMFGSMSLEAARKDMNVEVGSIKEVHSDDLLEGEAYLMCHADQKTSNHAAIGVQNPGENLAIWGDNNPLAISANQDTLDVFQAAHVMEISRRFDLK